MYLESFVDGLDEGEVLEQGYLLSHKIKVVKTKEASKTMKTSRYTLVCANTYEDRIVLMRDANLVSRSDVEVKFPLEFCC